MPNGDFFYFARYIRKLCYYDDVIHSFDWKLAVAIDRLYIYFFVILLIPTPLV